MKDAYYFPHDYNAANDQKILKVRVKFNNFEGYGIVFALFETMAQEENGHIDREAIGGLSLGYSIPIDLLNSIISYCLEIELFKEDAEGIYNDRMMQHKTTREKYKEAGKIGASIRWKGTNRGAIKGVNAKERKGKERKDNNKENVLPEKAVTKKQIKPCRNSLTPCDEYCLWEIGNEVNVHISWVKKTAKKLKEQIEVDGNPKKYSRFHKTLANWVEGSVAKGYTPTMNETEQLGMPLDHPDKVKERMEAHKKMVERGIL